VELQTIWKFAPLAVLKMVPFESGHVKVLGVAVETDIVPTDDGVNVVVAVVADRDMRGAPPDINRAP
jgi:hypothetical protein